MDDFADDIDITSCWLAALLAFARKPHLLCRMSPSCFSANFFDVRAVELVLCALLAALLWQQHKHLTNTILAKRAAQKIETLVRDGLALTFPEFAQMFHYASYLKKFKQQMNELNLDKHCSRAGTSASRRLSWNFGHRVKFFSIHWFVS